MDPPTQPFEDLLTQPVALAGDLRRVVSRPVALYTEQVPPAALRVTPAHAWRHGRLAPEVWLLMQRPVDSHHVAKYFFIHLPETTPLKRLVWIARLKPQFRMRFGGITIPEERGHSDGRVVQREFFS